MDDQPLPPKYLFVWKSDSGLHNLAKAAENTGQTIPLPPINPSTYFASRWKSFRGRPGLFAWSHPTAAIAFGGEFYAKTETTDERYKHAHPPRLVEYIERGLIAPGKVLAPHLLCLRINPNARVIYLKNNGTNKTASDSENQNEKMDADLVLHDFKDLDSELREWILINPNVVESFTADPNMFPAEVRREILRTTVRAGELEDDQKFLRSYDSEKDFPPWTATAEYRSFLLGPYLQRLKSGIISAIPEIFRRSMDKSKPRNCNDLLSGHSPKNK